ncbi:MAG: glutamate racemase [Anaerolineae bacterium]|nr:glutamate racemase [Anaerolineae bacterium]
MTTGPSSPIGILDSGVGGLSILRALRRELPAESLIYIADQAHLPYGPRPLAEIRTFVQHITTFLLAHEAKLIVIACNAASAAGLHDLRAMFPDVPFVGMEPAVKTAAAATRSGAIGVLTTAATANGTLYASVRERFAANVHVETVICPELVEAVEANATSPAALRPLFERVLAPALARGIDQLVLACTHFPFALEALQAFVGPQVAIIDPSPAIARQARRVLADRQLLAPEATRPTLRYYTTGDASRFSTLASNLLGEPIQAQALRWAGEQLLAGD